MSVHDAEPGDIYADETGKLWRITMVCRDPAVEAEEVEGTLFDPHAPPLPPSALQSASAYSAQNFIARAKINKRQVSGGVGGQMWRGWQRIWRGKQSPNPIS
jgi:hypothetical protein